MNPYESYLSTEMRVSDTSMSLYLKWEMFNLLQPCVGCIKLDCFTLSSESVEIYATFFDKPCFFNRVRTSLHKDITPGIEEADTSARSLFSLWKSMEPSLAYTVEFSGDSFSASTHTSLVFSYLNFFVVCATRNICFSVCHAAKRANPFIYMRLLRAFSFSVIFNSALFIVEQLRCPLPPHSFLSPCSRRRPRVDTCGKRGKCIFSNFMWTLYRQTAVLSVIHDPSISRATGNNFHLSESWADLPQGWSLW